jgi:ferredoxin-type protein NapG
VEHRYNLPEGVRYDLQGKGLIVEPEGQQAMPLPSSPLDRLNRGLENQ